MKNNRPPSNALDLTFKPVTKELWRDLEALFGERGACGGCWCMLWRLTRKEFEARKGEGNRLALKAIVQSGEEPGLLAFHDRKPVGWCAIAPRQRYSALARSRVLKPVDDRECWSVACFFIEKSFRRKGVSVKLLRAATEYARSKGAMLVEGYPVEPKTEKDLAPAFAWTGIPGAFLSVGFREVARRSPTRPIMRLEL